MARRVQDAQGDVLERQRRLVGQRGIDGKSRKARGHEGQLRETLPIEDGEVVRVHGDRRTGFLMQGGHTADVVDMSVGDEDPLQGQLLLSELPQHAIGLQPRIDGERRRRVATADQVAVLTEEIVGKDRDGELFA